MVEQLKLRGGNKSDEEDESGGGALCLRNGRDKVHVAARWGYFTPQKWDVHNFVYA